MSKFWKIFLSVALAVLVIVGIYFFIAVRKANSKPASVYDNLTKEQIVCNHVIILVKPDLSATALNSYLAGIKGKILSAIPMVNGLGVWVPGKCDAQTVYDAVKYFKGKDKVLDASPEKSI